MRKLKLYLIWCLVVGTLVSCDKKDDSDPAPAVAQDYLPTTAGSIWTYGGSSPYTLRSTGVTKTTNNKIYYEMETQQGTSVSKSYVLKENGSYTGIGMVPGMGTLEMTILKDNVPVGQTWEQTTTTSGVGTKFTYTVVEKNVTKAVEGKTYNNVIHVKLTYGYNLDDEDFGLGEDFDLGDLGMNIEAHYYFAKGVGLILSDMGPYGQVPLVSCTVK
ncbi:hypothetical protein [Adhaeribacter pallidiroseus]|uniref:Lipoprotein n=1 Tax=Adhaeribacter pallidiroseus TaxID=2072847 RepID=A0A369QHJ1_9BACT|nr:hypothetical protein [Adhaeribacter pallidiroseus]RDC62349.1 hypothetical protein AHMF7616_00942 [Adhaeribacter pallidiroseus]